MDPLDWIELHRREDWATAQTRAEYEAEFGRPAGLTDAQWATQWRSAVSSAFQRERVADAISGAYTHQTMGAVLYGLLSFGQEVVVRIRVTGTDASGHRASVPVDVHVRREDTIDDLWRLAHEAIEADPSASGLDIESLDVMSGSYAA